MRKILFALMLLPMLAMAQTVKSPNGNVSVKFSLDNGRPVYEVSYKKRAVVKPSYLGLELAKTKHASKGMEETSLMDGFVVAKTDTSTFDETWKPVWGETATIRNHSMSSPLRSTSRQQSATSLSVSVYTTTEWACATSFRSRKSSTISL